MRFILEESSWIWDGSEPAEYIERIEQLLDRTDVARDRDEPLAASRELMQQKVLSTHALYALLWDPDSPVRLPPEVLQRVNALFGAIRYWDDEIDWLGFEARIAGRDVVSPSAVLAQTRVREGKATACLPLPGAYEGPCNVIVNGTEAQIHFVVNEASHRAFFRDVLDVERADEAGLETLAPHAFPDLFFLNGVWDGLRHFEGGYARVRSNLHHLLAVLDDHGAWVFTDKTGRLSRDQPEPSDNEHKPGALTDQIVERRFKRWGLEIAPEHPDVKADGRCRRVRERVLGGRTLYCEWHYKFEKHTNRAHIHPPIPGSEGKLIVAIFRDHLRLPGDD